MASSSAQRARTFGDLKVITGGQADKNTDNTDDLPVLVALCAHCGARRDMNLPWGRVIDIDGTVGIVCSSKCDTGYIQSRNDRIWSGFTQKT